MEEKKKVGVGVGVMILDEGKVLLGKRHEDPEKADSELHGEGTWTMPGGKVHFGERLFQAAKREIYEETRISINENDLKLISLTDDFAKDAHFITIGFLCERHEGEPTVMEPDEITEWQWFNLCELPSKMFSPSKKILDKYLNSEEVYQ